MLFPRLERNIAAVSAIDLFGGRTIRQATLASGMVTNKLVWATNQFGLAGQPGTDMDKASLSDAHVF